MNCCYYLSKNISENRYC